MSWAKVETISSHYSAAKAEGLLAEKETTLGCTILADVPIGAP